VADNPTMCTEVPDIVIYFRSFARADTVVKLMALILKYSGGIFLARTMKLSVEVVPRYTSAWYLIVDRVTESNTRRRDETST
jgi:hypothetical protein